MLITGITNAQDYECYPDCPPEEAPVEFNFTPDNCVEDYDTLYSDEITEIKEIVALFFTELEYYNDAYVNYDGVYNQDAWNEKQRLIHLYPYDGIVAEDYTVDIDFYPFSGLLSGAAAKATTCNGDAIHIEVNSNKWFTELDNEELDSEGNIWENNQNNPVLPRLKKKFVIYHELGHAVLNLDHNCDTEVDQYAEIMKTTQCTVSTGTQSYLSFPYDFPVFTDNDFYNKAKRMWQKVGQVEYPSCESSYSAPVYTTSYKNAAATQAPRERYHEDETDLEYYGDTDLTYDQLQNRVDAIDAISKPDTATVKYGWESLNRVYYIQISDLLYEPIESEVAAVKNLTTLTFDEFNDLVDWTIVWRNDFISKIANNHLPDNN